MKNERLRKGILVGTMLMVSVGMFSGCTPKSAKERASKRIEAEMNSSEEVVSETTRGAKETTSMKEETTKKKQQKSEEGKKQSSGGKQISSSKETNHASEDDYIGLEKAKSIAVSASKISRRKVYVASAYLSNQNYHIILGGDGDKEHIFTIDGKSGDVISHSVSYPEDNSDEEKEDYEDEDDWDDYDDYDDWDDEYDE
ncbi:MAG: hypothetical protein K6G64_09930 [Eubacterium sp.]|nr:hypothetical protein [Eubacterium sp.]